MESFVEYMQSKISAWRAKRIYCVQFSEKAVFDCHPKESVIFFRNSLKKENSNWIFQKFRSTFLNKINKIDRVINLRANEWFLGTDPFKDKVLSSVTNHIKLLGLVYPCPFYVCIPYRTVELIPCRTLTKSSAYNSHPRASLVFWPWLISLFYISTNDKGIGAGFPK